MAFVEAIQCRKKSTAPNRIAFVGAYTGYEPGALGWVGSKTPGVGISAFSFDEMTGKLSNLQKVVEQDSPSWLEVDPSGKYLVTTHELSHHTGVAKGVGWLTSYSIVRDEAGVPTGDLAKICTASTGGNGNTAATFDSSGHFLFVTRYWEGGVSILPFDAADGSIGEATLYQHEGKGPHPLRQSSSHPHGIHSDPVSNMVFAMDLGTDYVHQYRLEAGALIAHANAKVAMPIEGSGAGPRGINFHPSKRIAYVNCELNGTVVVCSVDEEAGLRPIQTLYAYPEDFVGKDHPQNLGKAGLWGAEAAITNDGAWYFYICRVHQSIAIFTVHSDGTLALKGRQPLVDFSNARNLDIHESDAGSYLLVASQDANCVEVFRVHLGDGTLEKTDQHAAPCAADVAVV